MKQILREITPLGQDKLFFSKFTPAWPMNFPLHYHDDFELTLTTGVRGKRIVGNLVEDFDEIDLVLIGPNVPHCFKRDPDCFSNCDSTVIQFSRRLSDYIIFSTDILRPISEMLYRSSMGIRFSAQTARELADDIIKLHDLTGIDSILSFMRIMYELAVSKGQIMLSAVSVKGKSSPSLMSNNDRINRIFKYVELNYMNKITLDEIGDQIQMSPSAVSRFFKGKTMYRFSDFLNDYRVDRVAQLMLTTDDSISEICYACGFNNVANFNRAFKKRMGMTPSDYRKSLKMGVISNEGVLLKRWNVINGQLV